MWFFNKRPAASVRQLQKELRDAQTRALTADIEADWAKAMGIYNRDRAAKIQAALDELERLDRIEQAKRLVNAAAADPDNVQPSALKQAQDLLVPPARGRRQSPQPA